MCSASHPTAHSPRSGGPGFGGALNLNVHLHALVLDGVFARAGDGRPRFHRAPPPSYDLCLYLEQVVRSFSRYHKYTLGSDLREGARHVLKLIVRANARRDKTPLLVEAREEVEQLKVVPRLSQDVKAFASFGAFERAIEQVVDIAKQNEGWLKSQRQRLGQNRRAMPDRPAAPGAP